MRVLQTTTDDETSDSITSLAPTLCVGGPVMMKVKTESKTTHVSSSSPVSCFYKGYAYGPVPLVLEKCALPILCKIRIRIKLWFVV